MQSFDIYTKLVTVAEQTGLSINLVGFPEDRFYRKETRDIKCIIGEVTRLLLVLINFACWVIFHVFAVVC